MTSSSCAQMVRADFPDVSQILEATGLFPSDMLPDMFDAAPQFGAAQPIWRVIRCDGEARGFGYAEQESFTEATWNMRALGVLPAHHGTGLGRTLVADIESAVRDAGGALMIIDTAGVPDFDPARRFYHAIGYAETACIEDFWAPGVSKVTFRKDL